MLLACLQTVTPGAHQTAGSRGKKAQGWLPGAVLRPSDPSPRQWYPHGDRCQVMILLVSQNATETTEGLHENHFNLRVKTIPAPAVTPTAL